MPAVCPGCAFCLEHPSPHFSAPNSHSLFQVRLGRPLLRGGEVDWGGFLHLSGSLSFNPSAARADLKYSDSIRISRTTLPPEMEVQRGEETCPRTHS